MSSALNCFDVCCSPDDIVFYFYDLYLSNTGPTLKCLSSARNKNNSRNHAKAYHFWLLGLLTGIIRKWQNFILFFLSLLMLFSKSRNFLELCESNRYNKFGETSFILSFVINMALKNIQFVKMFYIPPSGKITKKRSEGVRFY